MTTTEILHDLIYPAIYDKVETVFPEFRFKKRGHDSGYISTNGFKIDGTNGDAQGRVRIYHDNISHLIDHRIGSISIWDYIQKRENLNDQKTLLALADYAEVRLPERHLPAEEMEKIKVYKRRAEIWEQLNTYLKNCFYDPQTPQAKSKESAEVRTYLCATRETGGRGFLPGDIEVKPLEGESKSIEVGVLSDVSKAYGYLIDKGYPEAELRDVLKLTEDARIGKGGYILTLPYRDAGGSIRGLLIRNIKFNPSNKTNEPKYLFTKSLDGVKGKLLYNLKPLTGSRDLLIVESQFDAQLATVRDIDNVVAIGGKDITIDQVKQALKIRPRVNSITILLDNEPETIPQIKAAISKILAEDPLASVFVAEIKEDGVKDLEEYLIKFDADTFKKEVLIKKAIYWKYLLNGTIGEFTKTLVDREPTDAEEEQFLKAIVTQASGILSPNHKEQYLKEFSSTIKESLSLSLHALEETSQKIKESQNLEEQASELRKTIAKATDLQSKGQTAHALELLINKGREIRDKKHLIEFNGLLTPTDQEQVKERIKGRPDNLETDLIIGQERLLIPAGAISIFAAPTSHGKTTFLINLALKASERYKRKQFHLFSYEEDSDSVLVSALSTYIGEPISANNRRSIKSHYKDGADWFSFGLADRPEENKINLFKTKSQEFFDNLVKPKRFNVHYVDYDSDTLIDAIYFLHKQGDIGGVFIDYIQLLHKGERGNNKYGSRQEELKQICIDLKDVAVDTGLSIVLGAQFNRKVLNHLQLHPTMLGEAGDIERIANLIVGFWNNNFEVLASEDDLDRLNQLNCIQANTMYAKILKQRGGSVGSQGLLNYNGNVGLISNLKDKEEDPHKTHVVKKINNKK